MNFFSLSRSMLRSTASIMASAVSSSTSSSSLSLSASSIKRGHAIISSVVSLNSLNLIQNPATAFSSIREYASDKSKKAKTLKKKTPKKKKLKYKIKQKTVTPKYGLQVGISQMPDLSTHNISTDYKIKVGVCVERLPIITRVPEPIEEEYENLYDLVNSEKSFPSYRETFGEKDKPIVPENLPLPPDFVPAPRETEADKLNDRTSMNRKLDRRLYLVVSKSRDQHKWQFPQVERRPNEVLRETHDRIVRVALGPKFQYYCSSNAPCGFLQYDFPKAGAEPENEEASSKMKAKGAKIFFYRGLYVSGNLAVTTRKYDGFLWLTKEELPEYVSPDYYKAIEWFLTDF